MTENFINTILCLIISMVLYSNYYFNKINIVELYLWGISFNTFSIIDIGPTINVFFFINVFVLLKYLSKIFNLKNKFNNYIIFFIVFPLSIHILLLIFNNYFFIYRVSDNNLISYYFRPVYFYIKSYLFYFISGCVVYLEREKLQNYNYENTFKKITIVSILISFLQIVLKIYLDNPLINGFLGLNDLGKRYEYQLFGLTLVRVQAFFYEPKGLGMFLGISCFLFLKNQKLISFFIVFIVGVMTVSQTFFVIFLMSIPILILRNTTIRLRSQILMILIGVSFVFTLFSNYKLNLLDVSSSIKDSYLKKMVYDRALSRYNYNDTNNELFGMPLQGDLELPVKNYLSDYPILLVSGYGAGFNRFIPDEYFYGQWNYEPRRYENLEGHIDMGWFFIVAEFGVLFFIVFFKYFTNINIKNDNDKMFYILLFVAFFFARIEYLIIIFYTLFKTKDTQC